MSKSKLSKEDKLLLKRLFKDNFKNYAPLYLKGMIAMLVIALTTAASAAIMKNVVDSVVIYENLSMVFEVAAAVAAIFIIKGFASYFQTLYMSRAGNRVISEQQRKIYDKLVSQGVSFFQNNGASDLLLRVTNNAQSARQIIDLFISTYIKDIISVISLVCVMIWTNYWLTIIAFIVGPLFYLMVNHILKKVKKLMGKELLSLGEIMKVVQETSIGIRVIKAFALEEIMKQRINKAITDVEKRANKITSLQAATNPVMETLAGLSIAAVIAINGIYVIKHGGSPGDLMAFITAVILAYEPAKRIANSRIKLETGLVGLRMMFEILDHPITLKEEDDAVDLPQGNGEITFENVHFAYVENHDVLQNINLTVPSNKMTALVGPSGSGKSTMINLMMRLYDPTSGQIRVDGQDIKYTTFTSLRNRMSYVGQDTFLFQGSVKHNIRLGRPEASDDDIIEAAKAANAHDFITELPEGYESDVGENGNRLSGGQKQRIAIARAMLRNSEILILDEATSALDSESEALIQQALNRLTKGRTTIVIAHRLSTIARADQIVVLQQGNIVEKGTQNDLLKIEGGLYKKLHDLQFRHTDSNSFDDMEMDEVVEITPINKTANAVTQKTKTTRKTDKETKKPAKKAPVRKKSKTIQR